MRVNFFEENCKHSIKEKEFGILDGINTDPAFLSLNDKSKWIAIVENQKEILVDFYALDNCVKLMRNASEQEKSCDGLLVYQNNIVFFELKEVRVGGWITGGVEQLEESIKSFSKNHDLFLYLKRRAFLANRKHPSFKYSKKELMEKFKVATGVRLIIHNVIKI